MAQPASSDLRKQAHIPKAPRHCEPLYSVVKLLPVSKLVKAKLMQLPTATKSTNSSSASGKTGSRQLGTGNSSAASIFATRTTFLSTTHTHVGLSQIGRRV